MQKESKIEVRIQFDAERIPEKMFFTSSDQPESIEVKAMLVSMMDAQNLDTLKIDLWTKEMQIVEMDRLMYYTLRGLHETYQRATNNLELSNDFKQFVEYFADKVEIEKPSDQ